MTAAQQTRWQYERYIIQDLGRIPSCREMADLLKDKYGLIVNHNTVNADLKKDLEALTDTQVLERKKSLLTSLEDGHAIAERISKSDPSSKIRLDAIKTMAKVSETINRINIAFNKAKAELNEAQKPVYNVKMGKLEVVDEKEFEKMEAKDEDIGETKTENASE